MAKNACWGIDVGQCALKAIKLRQSGGEVEAVSFDVIEHAKILSQPDADEQQLIRNALDKFLSRNDVRNDLIVVGVPGQASFSRFIKLPPVELRKVPEIVRYEAHQQIPFNLDEVIWDYQTMTTPTGGAAEIEVGIFAMKRDIVQDYVNDFTQVKVTPDIVQMSPVALYNFLKFDRQDGAGATLLVDVGAENTSLVIADGYRVWIRNFPLGGNNFTQALVRAFKLTFGKAENLKRHAAESKYAREVFQAMRPVFTDLLTEVQRSIGFYTSLHRDSRIERVLAMGNTFRLPGLQKFLSQNLGVDVAKIARFNSLHGEQVTGAPVFKENILSFGVAYGLALQGLGLGAVTTSLLPPEILKEKEIRRKRPFVAAAAVAVVAGFALLAYGAHQNLTSLVDVPSETLGPVDRPEGGILRDVAQLKTQNDRYKGEFETAKSALIEKQDEIDDYLKLVGVSPRYSQDAPEPPRYRDMWYEVLTKIWSILPRDPNFATYDAETDTPPWNSFQVVELLKITGDVQTINPVTGQPVSDRNMMGGMPTAGAATDQTGVPCLIVTLEGTIPNPGREGPALLSRRMIQPLEERFRYSVKIVQAGEYRNATDSGYPYEAKDPRVEREQKRKEQEEKDRAAGGRTERKKEEEEPIRRPWRGQDYWFRLSWAINLEHPDQPVVYKGTGTSTGTGTGYPPSYEGYGTPDFTPATP